MTPSTLLVESKIRTSLSENMRASARNRFLLPSNQGPNLRVFGPALLALVIMVTMLAVVSPMSTVRGGRGIIRIRIPSIRIVVDVRVPRVSVGIIIKVIRRTVVAARKSETESLSSRNQDRCRALSVRTLGRNEGQPAYRHCS